VKENNVLATIKDSKVPVKAFKLFGCLHCPWRNTKDCPFLDDEKIFTNIPIDGICDKRRMWVISLSPQYDKVPTLSQWRMDINKNITQTRLEKDKYILDWLEEQYATEENEDQRRMLQKQAHKVRMDWERLNNIIMKYDDLQVNRETPKKLEIEHSKKPTLEMLHDLMREKSIDVETIDD